MERILRESVIVMLLVCVLLAMSNAQAAALDIQARVERVEQVDARTITCVVRIPDAA